jgi:hypothetical protein
MRISSHDKGISRKSCGLVNMLTFGLSEFAVVFRNSQGSPTLWTPTAFTRFGVIPKATSGIAINGRSHRLAAMAASVAGKAAVATTAAGACKRRPAEDHGL